MRHYFDVYNKIQTTTRHYTTVLYHIDMEQYEDNSLNYFCINLYFTSAYERGFSFFSL